MVHVVCAFILYICWFEVSAALSVRLELNIEVK